MDNQNLVSRPTGDQESANLNITMRNTGPHEEEAKSHSNLSQQQQTSESPQVQASISHSHAPPMQSNLISPNDQQQQMIKSAQHNTPPMSQGLIQQPIQQHQPQLQQAQYHQPQMPPQHQPTKPLLSNDSNITIPPHANAGAPNQGQNAKQGSLSPQKAVITKVRLSDELNIFDWFRTKEIISQIAERAKSSVDSVITTLDPGMKEYLYSGGNVNIFVISDNECLVSPIRDAFQSVFGRATVAAARHSSSASNYPIRTANGLQEAVSVARARIKNLRQDTNSVPQNQVVIAIQPTLLNMDITDSGKEERTDGTKIGEESTGTSTVKWFFTYCILIEDPVLNVTLNCYSQFIPIETDIVDSAKAVQLPADFPDKHLGFAGTIGELVAYKLRLNPNNGFSDEYGCLWLREWAGLYETQVVHQLSLTIAHSYRRKWNDCARLDTVS